MAGRIPDALFREIVERSDMVAIVNDVVKLQRAGRELRGLCPFHAEKTPSFYVNAQSKVYICRGCQAGGDVVSFVRETRGLHFAEAVEWLAGRAGITMRYEDEDPTARAHREEQRSQRARLLELNAAALRYFRGVWQRPEGEAARRYALGRGLQPETMERFGVGAAPDAWDGLVTWLQRQGFGAGEIIHVGLGVPRREGQGLYDRFRHRLMYPVHATSGDLVAFGGRDLSDAKDVAKYMNSPESELDDVQATQNSALWKFFKKSNVLYGLWQARAGIRRHQCALLVEGNLDVMTLHQHGLDHAVAPMGTAVTEAQLHELRRFTERVVICLDGDRAGRAAALKTIPLALSAGLDGYAVWLPEGEDPDSMVRRYGVEALQSAIAGADDLVTAYVQALVQTADRTISGRVDIAQQVEHVLAAMPNPVVREAARQILFQQLDIGPQTLDELARRRRHTSEAAAPVVTPVQPPPAALQPRERELAEAAMWHPELLLELVHIGALELLADQALRETLQALAARAEQQGHADTHTVRCWLMDLPPSAVRTALLSALAEAPRISGPALRPHVESVLDGLEIEHLTAELARIRGAGLGPADAAAFRQSFEVTQRIAALKLRRQGAAAAVAGAASGAVAPLAAERVH